MPFRFDNGEIPKPMLREVEHNGCVIYIMVEFHAKPMISAAVHIDAVTAPVHYCRVSAAVDGMPVMQVQYVIPSKVMTTVSDMEIEAKRYASQEVTDYGDVIGSLTVMGFQQPE